MVCWGHQGSMWRPGMEADQSTLELVGYQTSQKEIPDIYHSVCFSVEKVPWSSPFWVPMEKGSN